MEILFRAWEINLPGVLVGRGCLLSFYCGKLCVASGWDRWLQPLWVILFWRESSCFSNAYRSQRDQEKFACTDFLGVVRSIFLIRNVKRGQDASQRDPLLMSQKSALGSVLVLNPIGKSPWRERRRSPRRPRLPLWCWLWPVRCPGSSRWSLARVHLWTPDQSAAGRWVPSEEREEGERD